MTSQNTAVYRYHGISSTVYNRRAFLDTAHPYLGAQQVAAAAAAATVASSVDDAAQFSL